MNTTETLISAIPLLWLAAAPLGMPASPQSLTEILDQRLAGDRSGVCVAVARVTDTVEMHYHCSDPERARTLNDHSRFEIGSISKALQGVLIARLEEQGELSLDEPLAALLPDGQTVPDHDSQVITVQQVLTHVAGLKRLPLSLMWGAQSANPYAHLDEDRVLATLADQRLRKAPGEAFEYSNLGAMVLSTALVHRTGRGLDRLLAEEIFEPLGMTDSSLDGPTVQGHDARGLPVSNWDLPANLAGVAGVRATLPDMVRLIQAMLGQPANGLETAIARSMEPIRKTPDPTMGYGWLLLDQHDRRIAWHNGGTGGFASMLAVDRDNGVGVVVLADAAMWAHGGLDDLALHLIDPAFPLAEPRKTGMVDRLMRGLASLRAE
ncbi:MAG: beta-lactamase family protein [Wenzhouxiangella sp.]|nr:beta-lactamase family protein [Wenzhouxiangella sp.]